MPQVEVVDVFDWGVFVNRLLVEFITEVNEYLVIYCGCVALEEFRLRDRYDVNLFVTNVVL